MRAERFAPAPARSASIGPTTMILAAIGCFTIGFVALMAVPRLWPKYVQTPIVASADAPQPIVPGTTASTAAAPQRPAPGVVTEIRPTSTVVPQRIQAFGALANLAECKAAIRAGESFENVGPDQMAAMFGTRGKPLTGTQIDAGCRKLTE